MKLEKTRVGDRRDLVVALVVEPAHESRQLEHSGVPDEAERMIARKRNAGKEFAAEKDRLAGDLPGYGQAVVLATLFGLGVHGAAIDPE